MEKKEALDKCTYFSLKHFSACQMLGQEFHVSAPELSCICFCVLLGSLDLGVVSSGVLQSLYLGVFPLLWSPCNLSLITILLQTFFYRFEVNRLPFFFSGLLSQMTSWQFKNIVVLTASKCRRLIFGILLHFLSVPITSVVLLFCIMLLMYCLLCNANNKVTSNLKDFVLF